jgi:hypothetical protein
VEANSTGGQGSRRAVAPSDDDELVYSTALVWLSLTLALDLSVFLTASTGRVFL